MGRGGGESGRGERGTEMGEDGRGNRVCMSEWLSIIYIYIIYIYQVSLDTVVLSDGVKEVERERRLTFLMKSCSHKYTYIHTYT